MKIDIKKVPNTPGVYKFFNNQEIIYIGKAKNLKKRVSSYFGKSFKDRKTSQIKLLTDKIETFTTKNEVEALLLEQSLIKENKPKYVIINLGGGVQEVLGSFIKKETENCVYKPIIICTGAAIAFLTGSQVKIPTIIDRIYLGWLARCISNPKVFVPRYLRGFNLVWLVMKNKIRDQNRP